jgi:hypothetical protein
VHIDADRRAARVMERRQAAHGDLDSRRRLDGPRERIGVVALERARLGERAQAHQQAIRRLLELVRRAGGEAGHSPRLGIEQLVGDVFDLAPGSQADRTVRNDLCDASRRRHGSLLSLSACTEDP